MRLLFVRHAQTPVNASGVLSTAVPGPGLTVLGYEQAEALPGALARRSDAGSIAAVYVSTLVRTGLTAEPLARALGVPIVVLPGLQEIEAGDAEDTADEASLRAYLTPIQVWGRGDMTATIPGAFDGMHFFTRFDAAVAAIEADHPDDPDATVVIVSHGVAIRVWVAGRADNVDAHFTTTHDLGNTGVVAVVGSSATGWHVETWEGDPVGGPAVTDNSAPDPAGEPLEPDVPRRNEH